MIEGHGDDAYRYGCIENDFSSNICSVSDDRLRPLMEHLAAMPHLLSHYPEPEAWSLEAMIAERHGIDPCCVIVTSGATDAIYLVAQALYYRSVIPAPTFREYEDACRMFESSKVQSSTFKSSKVQKLERRCYGCAIPTTPRGRC